MANKARPWNMIKKLRLGETFFISDLLIRTFETF